MVEYDRNIIFYFRIEKFYQHFHQFLYLFVDNIENILYTHTKHNEMILL